MHTTSHAKTLRPSNMAYGNVYDFDITFEAGTAAVVVFMMRG